LTAKLCQKKFENFSKNGFSECFATIWQSMDCVTGVIRTSWLDHVYFSTKFSYVTSSALPN